MLARLTVGPQNYLLICASCSKTSQFPVTWLQLGLATAPLAPQPFRASSRAGTAPAILCLEDNATGIDLHPAKRSSATWGWVSDA